MTKLKILSIVCVLIGAVGCSTISVSYDYDTKADFNALNTFDLIPVPERIEINQLNVERLKTALIGEMEARGYTLSVEDPDFLIAMHGGKEEKIQVTDWGYSYSPFGNYRGYGGYGHRGLDVYQYEEGSIIIDFIDGKTRKLIWRGEAKAVLDQNPTPEDQTRLINEAVNKLLMDFPPPETAKQ